MLDRHFHERGIAVTTAAGGATIPMVFTDARAEHRATRQCAGLFDFSFMGAWELSGSAGLAFLQRLQTRHVAALRHGRLCYTLLCREDGHVFNDATIWRHENDRFWLFTGKRNDQTYLAAQAAASGVTLRALHPDIAVIALQGPRSKTVLSALVEPGVLDRLAYFSFITTTLAGRPVTIGRLGYSGEFGYELILPAADAVPAWQLIEAQGKPHGLLACGFEAANILRIESGYILFSNELREPVTPRQLGLQRLLERRPGGFIGQAAIRALADTAAPRLVGIKLADQAARGPGRGPMARITSIARSPLFQSDLALGFVDQACAEPGNLVITPEGRCGRVHRLPFYDPPRIRPRRDPDWPAPP